MRFTGLPLQYSDRILTEGDRRIFLLYIFLTGQECPMTRKLYFGQPWDEPGYPDPWISFEDNPEFSLTGAKSKFCQACLYALKKGLPRMVNLGNSHLFRFGPFDADFVRKLILYKRLRRICAILSGKSRFSKVKV